MTWVTMWGHGAGQVSPTSFGILPLSIETNLESCATKEQTENRNFVFGGYFDNLSFGRTNELIGRTNLIGCLIELNNGKLN